MLEHSIYTVASPEASASILWRDAAKAQEAATTMKITAQDLLRFGIIDGIISEPAGGAHRDAGAAIDAAGRAIETAFAELAGMDRQAIQRDRSDKFLAIGRRL
jgi:acetyl-CoA carboxylase carboxyl transferase subunit alpha